MRGPGRLVLHHHEAFEGRKVRTRRLLCQRMVCAGCVPHDRRDGRAGSRVPRKRLEEPADPLRIPGDPVHASDVHPADFVQVVAVGQKRRFPGLPSGVPRPAADADQRGQVRKRLVADQARHRHSPEEPLQGNPSCCMPEFEERHGTEPEAAHPASSRVPRDVVGWHGGSGEDEVPEARPIVDGSPHVVPDVGLGLPFVDQSRSRSLDKQPRIDSHRGPHGRIRIHEHLARRRLPGRRGLAANPRTLDHDSSRCREPPDQFPVGDPGTIGRRGCGTECHVRRHGSVIVILQYM